MCGCAHVTVYLWQSKDNLKELVLSFRYAGPEAQTQVIRCGSKSLYPLNHLAGPFSLNLISETYNKYILGFI